MGTILYIFWFGTLTLGTDLAADWQNPASNPLELHVCYSKSFIQHSKSSKIFACGAFLWWSLFSVVHPRRNNITTIMTQKSVNSVFERFKFNAEWTQLVNYSNSSLTVFVIVLIVPWVTIIVIIQTKVDRPYRDKYRVPFSQRLSTLLAGSEAWRGVNCNKVKRLWLPNPGPDCPKHQYPCILPLGATGGRYP